MKLCLLEPIIVLLLLALCALVGWALALIPFPTCC